MSISSFVQPAPEKKPTIWQRDVFEIAGSFFREMGRKIASVVLHQFKQGITPDRVALTVAMGVAFGLFPLFGTTTLLCLLVAFWMRLNQPIIHLVNQLLWPVHIAAVYFFIRLGGRLFHAEPTHVNLKFLNHLLWHNPVLLFHRFGSIILYPVVAWVICVPFVALALYFVLCPLLRNIAALSAEACAREAAAAAAKNESNLTTKS